MRNFKMPVPIDNEIPVSSKKTLMSKTNKKGIIYYANETFMKICGYKEWELMGQPHNVIRHPDMPKVLFKVLWDFILNKKKIYPIVKNLAKDGSYYWVIADFDYELDDNGDIKSFFSRRVGVPESAKKEVTGLYKKLLEIEKNENIDTSEQYLNTILNEMGMSFNEYMLSLVGMNEKEFLKYVQSKNERKIVLLEDEDDDD